jgi:hypothetical protein
LAMNAADFVANDGERQPIVWSSCDETERWRSCRTS